MRIGGALRDDTSVCGTGVGAGEERFVRGTDKRGRADLWQRGRDEEWPLLGARRFAPLSWRPIPNRRVTAWDDDNDDDGGGGAVQDRVSQVFM